MQVSGLMKEKVKFSVERTSIGVHAMIILMALSVAFRIIGCWGMWTDRNCLVFQICLPILSAVLMILLVWLFGRRALWMAFRQTCAVDDGDSCFSRGGFLYC